MLFTYYFLMILFCKPKFFKVNQHKIQSKEYIILYQQSNYNVQVPKCIFFILMIDH